MSAFNKRKTNRPRSYLLTRFTRTSNPVCPIPGGDYKTPDLDPPIVAALLNAHTTVHTGTLPAKEERVKRPTISAAEVSSGIISR